MIIERNQKYTFRIALIIGFCLLVLSKNGVLAQISSVDYQASNRLQYRISWPQKEEVFRDWMDVDYYLDNFITGLRFELNQPTQGNLASQSITQRYFEYSGTQLRLRMGNYYKRLERGLIFHSFELQKISLNRFEQNFIIDRNMDGLLLEWENSHADLTLFSGRPNWRGPDKNLRGAEFVLRPMGRTEVSFSYLRSNQSLAQKVIKREFIAGGLGVNGKGYSLYGEYAFKRKRGAQAWNAPDRAYYLSGNFFLGNLGVSLEYKDYLNFNTGLNNPPTLVKEHSFGLLNRHTHQVNLADERGFQLETTYSPHEQTTLTANLSAASNHKGEENSVFREVYLEIRQELSECLTLRSGLDHSIDRMVGDDWRNSIVMEADYYFRKNRSFTMDVQWQRIKNLYLDSPYANALFLIGYNHAPLFSLNLQWETTTSPLESQKHWLMCNVNVKIGTEHDLYLSIGERRAGIACAGGQCLFMPEFRGIELRLNSRF